jgi:hypothetical protein
MPSSGTFTNGGGGVAAALAQRQSAIKEASTIAEAIVERLRFTFPAPLVAEAQVGSPAAAGTDPGMSAPGPVFGDSVI